MLSPFQFRTISNEPTGEFRDKGSRFIGYARRVDDEAEAEIFLEEIRSLHPKARHHCYAWRIGHPEEEERANDDGEPSGTAGRPILGQLVRLELTNVMVIVVRYFGGVLLGTGGLIQAYKTCAADTLAEAETIVVDEVETWNIEVDFSIVYILEEWAPRLEFEITERTTLRDRMIYKVEIEKSRSAGSRKELTAKLLDIYPEEVEMESRDYSKVRWDLLS